MGMVGPFFAQLDVLVLVIKSAGFLDVFVARLRKSDARLTRDKSWCDFFKLTVEPHFFGRLCIVSAGPFSLAHQSLDETDIGGKRTVPTKVSTPSNKKKDDKGHQSRHEDTCYV